MPLGLTKLGNLDPIVAINLSNTDFSIAFLRQKQPIDLSRDFPDKKPTCARMVELVDTLL